MKKQNTIPYLIKKGYRRYKLDQAELLRRLKYLNDKEEYGINKTFTRQRSRI